MKTCKNCGSMFYAHGHYMSKLGVITERYICKSCKRCVSVRNGELVHGTGVRKADWRTMGDENSNGNGKGSVDGGQVSDKRDLGVQALEKRIADGQV